MTSEEDEIESDNAASGPSKITDSNRITPPPVNVPAKKGAVKDLSPMEVRWFYRESKSSQWIPFKGRDSLMIEIKRRMHLNLPFLEDFANKEDVFKACRKTPVILDGYYELLIGENVLKPIYWEDEPIEIMRGTWFTDTDWLPLDQEMADEIEQQHLKMFHGQKIPESPVYTEKGQKPILHSMVVTSCKVEWNSIIDISLEPNNKTWMMSLRLKSAAVKIRRSYHTESTYEDGPHSVNHIVFVVPGIGQKRQQRQIIKNTASMRTIAEKQLKYCFDHIKFRPMFIPLEWRTSLKLNEDLIEAITPNNVQFVRALLNTTAMDIMYYSSPKYRSEIAAGTVAYFNRLYSIFLNHNPTFERLGGSISIVAHSLGSVLSYDVISHWSPVIEYEEFVTQKLKNLLESKIFGADTKERLRNLQHCRNELEDAEGGVENLVKLLESDKLHLKFKVSNLFCIGSPLSVFLALRGQTGRHILDNFSPTLYNIFNPVDPVAYRLEPLMHQLYAKVHPLRIHRFDSKNYTPYQEMPPELMQCAKSPAKENSGFCKEKNSAKKKSSKLEAKKDSLAMNATVEVAMVANTDSAQPTQDADDDDKGPPRRSWSAAVFSKFRSSPTPMAGLAVGSEKATVNPSSLTVSNQQVENVKKGFTLWSSSQESLPDVTTIPTPAMEPVVDDVTDTDLLDRIPESERLPYRMDFALKEGKLDGVLTTVTSHTNYWQKSDVVMFVLSHIYGPPQVSK